MKLEIHTISRDGLYEATATYQDGPVVVKKGSKINICPGEKYSPAVDIKAKLDDPGVVNAAGIVLCDVEFTSLSKAACFVTGRSANGMITWKTADGKYVRYSLK